MSQPLSNTDINNIWLYKKRNSKKINPSCQVGLGEFSSFGKCSAQDSRISPSKSWDMCEPGLPRLSYERGMLDLNESLNHGGI